MWRGSIALRRSDGGFDGSRIEKRRRNVYTTAAPGRRRVLISALRRMLNVVSLNQLRHIIAVNFPRFAFLIERTGSSQYIYLTVAYPGVTIVCPFFVVIT